MGRARGGSGLPATQWIARHGYLVIAPVAAAGLALGVHVGFYESPDLKPADLKPFDEITFQDRWRALESTPEPGVTNVAKPQEKTPARAFGIDSKPRPMPELAALAPDAGPLHETDVSVQHDDAERMPRLSEDEQFRQKGYIFYFNSPTHWAPVPLPAAVHEARAPHDGNIRAEIEQAAMLFDVDIRMMKAFARIESGFNPKATTGKYKCLFQLSDWEFRKYWQGDIYDIRDCSMAAARKLATEAAQFEKDVGRRATASEIYCIHQQGYQGCSFHHAAPHQLAWKNMYLTAEGQDRGEAWARKAIWGNVPSDIKDQIEGGVEALTSGQFIAIWTERVERFMARKVEPPANYDEYSAKMKKAKLAAKAKSKATAKGGDKTQVAGKAKTAGKTKAAKTKVAGKAKSPAAKTKTAKANTSKSRTKVASR